MSEQLEFDPLGSAGPGKSRSRAGAVAREFTPEEKNQAEVLSGFGLPHRQIAILMGCSEVTLRKHLGAELRAGDAKASAMVAQTMFHKAVSGDTTSAIFWLKARAGWKESNVQEHVHRTTQLHADVHSTTPVDAGREYTQLMGSAADVVPVTIEHVVDEEPEPE